MIRSRHDVAAKFTSLNFQSDASSCIMGNMESRLPVYCQYYGTSGDCFCQNIFSCVCEQTESMVLINTRE